MPALVRLLSTTHRILLVQLIARFSHLVQILVLFSHLVQIVALFPHIHRASAQCKKQTGMTSTVHVYLMQIMDAWALLTLTSASPQIACNTCSKTFRTEEALTRHEIIAYFAKNNKKHPKGRKVLIKLNARLGETCMYVYLTSYISFASGIGWAPGWVTRVASPIFLSLPPPPASCACTYDRMERENRESVSE